MKAARYASLVFRALYEIIRYEVIVSWCGIGCILRQLRQQRVSQKPCSEELQRAICAAVLLATCFYWKPVLCLQRSVCTVRFLRKYGIDARIVIGYRPSPFFSHAWVEVEERVVYGSAAYKKQLQPLFVS
jgi:Transglutaminase-like superfamily